MVVQIETNQRWSAGRKRTNFHLFFDYLNRQIFSLIAFLPLQLTPGCISNQLTPTRSKWSLYGSFAAPTFHDHFKTLFFDYFSCCLRFYFHGPLLARCYLGDLQRVIYGANIPFCLIFALVMAFCLNACLLLFYKTPIVKILLQNHN